MPSLQPGDFSSFYIGCPFAWAFLSMEQNSLQLTIELTDDVTPLWPGLFNHGFYEISHLLTNYQ